MDEEEFFRKLKTIRADTSLGDIVQIRSAGPDERKHFNSSQRRIYNDWKNRANKEMANKNMNISKEDLEAREELIKNMFKVFIK